MNVPATHYHRVSRIDRATQWLGALFALLAHSAAAATIAMSLASSEGTIEIDGTTELDADVETAWGVLTNYERYVDFIPGLRESRVVARSGATVTVEQICDITVGPLHRPLDVTFEITEMAPTLLVSRVVAGDLRALSSRYELTPLGNRVRVQYAGTLDSGIATFDPIERFAVRQNISSRFQALVDEIERRSAACRNQSRSQSSSEPLLHCGGTVHVLPPSLTSGDAR
jgi:carbon monoxide dehydrogenase subunit G